MLENLEKFAFSFETLADAGISDLRTKYLDTYGFSFLSAPETGTTIKIAHASFPTHQFINLIGGIRIRIQSR
jgi:hypothetical protein